MEKSIFTKRYIKFFFLLLLLCPTYKPLYADHENIILAVGAATVCGVGWGLHALTKSFSFNKAEERIDKAEKKIQESVREYNTIAQMIPQIHENEKHLEALIPYVLDQQSVHLKICHLDRVIESLQNDKNFIEKERLRWQDDTYYNTLKPKARRIEQELHKTLRFLTKVHTFLIKHRGYFELSNTCSRLNKEYGNELALLNGRTTASQATLEKINDEILQKYFNPKHGFPLISYAEHLQPSIELIETNAQKVSASSLYKYRKQEAQRLIEQLRFIRSFIAHNPHYQAQKTEFSRFQQDEKLLRIRQKEVEELTRKNKISLERLKEDQQKNDLLAQHIVATEEKTKEIERLQRRIPKTEVLIKETLREIKRVKDILRSLKAKQELAGGYSPESYEYEEIKSQIRVYEQLLKELFENLNTYNQKLKREL